MLDQMILFAQAATTAFLAGWMITGVKDNWLLPDLNGKIVGMILRVEKLEQMYPEAFDQLRHRRVTDERVHWGIFWFIVLWETLATLVLTVATGAMALAVFGQVDPHIARAMALLGATWFTSIWAGFLIFGNHWVYWYCHEWGQNNHFQLLVWGLGTMIFLVIGTSS